MARRPREWNGLVLDAEYAVRILNVLDGAGIETPEQVRQLGYRQLLRLPNMGVKSATVLWETVNAPFKKDPDQQTMEDELIRLRGRVRELEAKLQRIGQIATAEHDPDEAEGSEI